MSHYSPFQKSLFDLLPSDLKALRNTAEGWYIEYKQEVPKSESIAKSIAAMANSYGGWIFYGVQEESKSNSVAGAFPGVNISDADASLQKIRQAVAGALNPHCHYEARAINGPCNEIGLDDQKCIICIAVPQSIEAPHVHSKGVIYRRIADGSEPVAETDRHMIDKMFQRSKDTIDSFKDWIDRKPELSESESDFPFLRLMIVPNLWKMPRSNFLFNVDMVKNTLNRAEGRRSSLPFETIYTSSKGIVARQCINSNPTSTGLTWHIFPDLSGEILIPFSFASGSTLTIESNLHKHDHCDEFIQILERAKIDQTKVVNLSILFSLLMGIIEAQRALQKQAKWPLSFYSKSQLLNVWRTIPYIDCEFFIKRISENGIPICLTNESISPPGSHPDDFWYTRDTSEEADEQSQVILQTIWTLIPIAEAFGIPLRHLLNEDYEADWDQSGFISVLLQLQNTGIKTSNIK
ncbi:ATP-binding protein [Pseudomonas capeferrum]|uniref:AlbA family DNA-binding domain-containing protein n=1 Tax=Pseudomonas capeferrum TaxID=1495066 RepID=UPI0015E3B804|nr:ATP-binding protein [Pseudomonas capeferrum]MBA1202292.1 ATP-binding protein [Pseudomonas capeferrum]